MSSQRLPTALVPSRQLCVSHEPASNLLASITSHVTLCCRVFLTAPVSMMQRSLSPVVLVPLKQCLEPSLTIQLGAGQPSAPQQSLPMSQVAQSHRSRGRPSGTAGTPGPCANVSAVLMLTPFQQLSMSSAPPPAAEPPRQARCQVQHDTAQVASTQQLPASHADHISHSGGDDDAMPLQASPLTLGYPTAARQLATSSTAEKGAESGTQLPQLSAELRSRASALSSEPGGLDMDAFLPPSLSPRPVPPYCYQGQAPTA